MKTKPTKLAAKLITKSIFCVALAFFGMNNVSAQWQVINTGLSNKNINDLQSLGTILFASTDEGLFKSTDMGDNWSLTYDIGNVKQIASKGTDLFATIQDGVIGVAKSSDNGGTWTTLNTGLPYKFNSSIAVDGDVIYTCDYNKALRSTDDGLNWTDISTLPGFQTIVRNGSKLYAGSNNGGSGYEGIYVSNDEGLSWAQASNTGLVESIQRLVLSGNKLFAAADDGVYSTTNDGANWTKHEPSSGPTIDNAIGLHLVGTSLFIGTPAGIFLSTDNAASFSNVGGGVIGIFPVFSFTTIGTKIFTSCVYGDHGVFRREISEMLSVSGTSEIQKLSDFAVYPNPSKGKFKIAENNFDEISKIEVLNIFGQQVDFENNNYEITLTNPSKGIYFVRLFSDSKMSTQKIVVE
ncbi:MAG: T9SS type A sorting domain-containing protein [Bacteroidota bacterium]